MAKAFGQRPSVWLDGADEWIARDYDEAVFEFGEWFEGLREATKEVIPPKQQKRTVPVPKYGREQLLGALGYVIEDAPADELTEREANALYDRMMADLAEGTPPVA